MDYNPNFFTHIAMFGILFVSIHLFGKYPTRSAVIMILVGGWIFLPQAVYYIHLIPYRTKTNAISMALLLGLLLKKPQGFLKFRFSWVDLPIICLCLSGLGAYDGAQFAQFQIVDYGVPYVIGRSFFGSFESLKELAVGMFVGALILAPLVVIELAVSPQMHTWVYGWYPHDFSQTARDGGFRPSVFMSHGLELAIWNAAAAFVGCQMYLRGTLRGAVPLLKIPMLPSVLGLSLLLVVSHSTGAFFLFGTALVVTEISVRLKSVVPLLILAIFPILYIDLRSTGAWDGQSLIDASSKLTGGDESRTASLSFRIHNETLLAAKAREQFIFGWGRYQRSFVFDKDGNPITVPDGQWIVLLGEGGLFDLVAMNCIYLVPAILLFLKLPGKRLGGSLETPAVAFAIFFCITMIDNLFNSMSNPVLIVASGGILSLVLSPSAMKGLEAGAPRVSILQAKVATRVI